MDEYGEKYPDYVLERWRNPEPYLKYLELPGDTWNNKFFERIKPYIEDMGIKCKGKPSEAIREVYNYLKDKADERGLYPEQFDVTWDFARLCSKKSCDICPLSSSALHIKKLCIGELSDAKEKYCPLLSTICQYLIPCSPTDCPVFKNNTQGLCPRPEFVLAQKR